MFSYFECGLNQNKCLYLHEIYERVMETVKQYSGVAMQVLEKRHCQSCWRAALKGMVQKTAAWLSDRQYLLGCKGVDEADQSAVAIPFLKRFPKNDDCSKDVNVQHCSSAVLRSFCKKSIFSFCSCCLFVEEQCTTDADHLRFLTVG